MFPFCKAINSVIYIKVAGDEMCLKHRRARCGDPISSHGSSAVLPSAWRLAPTPAVGQDLLLLACLLILCL